MDAFCDFTGECGVPEFFSQKMVKARRVHKCCECYEEIKPGEIYERSAGKWDGEISSFATCRSCAGMRRDFAPHSCFGELDEILINHLGFEGTWEIR